MKKWTWRVVFCVGLLLPAGWVGVLIVRDAMRPPPAPRGKEVLGPFNTAVLRLEAKRLEAKQRVACAVIAGRMTLLQAAAALKALDARYRPYPGWAPTLPAADSDEEAYCLMAIGWVVGEAALGRADDLAGPLRAELAARRRDGTLRLPEADGPSAPDDGIPDGPAGPDGTPDAAGKGRS